ncbi:MAG TPA: TonB-dependent receptor plug domain-containing protein, partial [Longimicrobiales bacterium]|nr:TonB-dependent receptor plug domain-containing protein [Longimicrobiales bacterium]
MHREHAPLLFFLLAFGAAPARAQAPDTIPSPGDTTRVFALDVINVTATREPRSVFSTPAPVTVIDVARLRRSPGANVSDLFRGVPGLDAEGVGLAQRRPVVRGMRGQRVLLLEDGLRLNNPRRRVDSGEPTGLVWTSALERVEIVRGPASVLYGSDAVGGVVNLVTREAPARDARLAGSVEAGYRSAGQTSTLSGELQGAAGDVGWRLAGGLRDGSSYRAPAGSFGELTLSREAEVHDSAVRD